MNTNVGALQFYSKSVLNLYRNSNYRLKKNLAVVQSCSSLRYLTAYVRSVWDLIAYLTGMYDLQFNDGGSERLSRE